MGSTSKAAGEGRGEDEDIVNGTPAREPSRALLEGEDAAVLACSVLGPARLGVLWGRRPGRSHGLPQQPPETSPAEHMCLEKVKRRVSRCLSRRRRRYGSH